MSSSPSTATSKRSKRQAKPLSTQYFPIQRYTVALPTTCKQPVSSSIAQLAGMVNQVDPVRYTSGYNNVIATNQCVVKRTYTSSSLRHTSPQPIDYTVSKIRFNEQAQAILTRHQMLTETPHAMHVKDRCDRRRKKRDTSGERPFKCDICSKTYKLLGSVRRHRRLKHALFYPPSELKQHERVHTGEKPDQFVCEFCGVKYATKINLKTHINQLHTDECPYACDLCDSAFVKSFDLTMHHMNTHAHMYEYECSICTRIFGSRSSLEHHITATHEPVAEMSGSIVSPLMFLSSLQSRSTKSELSM